MLKKLINAWFVFIGLSSIIYVASENSLAIANSTCAGGSNYSEPVKWRFIWFNIIDNYKEVSRLITKES